MRMNEGKSVNSKCPGGSKVGECSSGQHGPQESCEGKSSADTSVEIC